MARGSKRRLWPAFVWGDGYQVGTLETTAVVENFSDGATTIARWGSDWSSFSADPGLVALGGATPVGHLYIGSFGSGAGPSDSHTWVVTGLNPAKTYHVRTLRQRGGFGGATTTFTLTVAGGSGGGTLDLDGPTSAPWEQSASLAVVPTVDGEITITAAATWDSGSGWRDYLLDNIQVYETAAIFPGALRFALDAASAWTRPRAGFVGVGNAGGSAYSTWHRGDDYLLSGVARQIPAVGGRTFNPDVDATGWDDVDGWQAFLAYARDRRPFTFLPDGDDAGTSYPVELVEPMLGPPEPDGNRFRQLRFTLRSLDGPFLGY